MSNPPWSSFTSTYQPPDVAIDSPPAWLHQNNNKPMWWRIQYSLKKWSTSYADYQRSPHQGQIRSAMQCGNGLTGRASYWLRSSKSAKGTEKSPHHGKHVPPFSSTRRERRTSLQTGDPSACKIPCIKSTLRSSPIALHHGHSMPKPSAPPSREGKEMQGYKHTG